MVVPELKIRLQVFQRDVLIIAIATCLISIASMAVLAFQVEYWRHDAARYLSDIDFLIRSRNDGRWLNHLLREPTAAIDPRLAWLVNYLSIGGGLYVLFQKIVPDNLTALLLALTTLLFPGLVAQTTWPDATLPGSIAFLISVLMVQKFGLVCLPFVAILQFATMQYFYYILPLAFVPSFATRRLDDFFKTIRIGVFWALGVLLGYYVAALANLFLVGTFGINVPAWRSPNVTNNFSVLGENVQRYTAEIVQKIDLWLPDISIVLIFGALVFVTLASIRSAKPLLALSARASYALVVLFSAYLFVLPLGIFVQYRSLLPMAVGLIALPIVLADRRFMTPVAIVLFAAIGLPSIYHSVNGLTWYSNTTRMVAEVLYKDLPPNGGLSRSIIIDGRRVDDFYESVTMKLTAMRSEPIQFAQTHIHTRLTPAFKEFGFRDVRWCLEGATASIEQVELCRKIDQFQIASKECNDDHGRICVLGERDGVLAIRLLP